MADQFVENNFYQGSTQVCASYVQVLQPQGRGANIDVELSANAFDVEIYSNEIDAVIESAEESI